MCEISQLCKVAFFVFVCGSNCQWNGNPRSGRWGADLVKYGWQRDIPQSAGDYSRTLSSWLSFAISVSLQLTGCIVCRIRSGGTSPIGPRRDLTATGTDLNPAQHVLYRPTKWVFTIIQVSHIPAVKGLELHSKQHLSGGLEESGGWPACLAEADQDLCSVLQEMIHFHIKCCFF